MKKIIDGKLYNTETAKEVVAWKNGYSRSDFKYCREGLYLTKKGNWFLSGEGGALSKYSESCGNGYSEGSGIIPITKKDALQWLEKRNKVEVIEEYFADEIEEA